MSEYYLVDIKSITSKVPRSEFKVDDIEALAQSILTAGGLLSPLLLKQTGVDSYEVLAGDHEYYAAVRAKEINPRSAEMVNSFIVPDELIDAAIEQFTSLHKTQSSLQAVDSSDAVLPATTSIAEQRLTNLESRIDGALRNIEQAHQRDIESLRHQIKIIQKGTSKN